jgi:CRP/FNR family transcriptional regulator
MNNVNQSGQVLLDNIGLGLNFMQQNGIEINQFQFHSAKELFNPGDACNLFLIIISGSIRVELISKKGREVTLYQIRAGESCVLTTSALLTKERYYARGLTEADVVALGIKPDDFHRLIQLSPMFSQFVLLGYAKRMSTIVSLVDRMATRDTLCSISELLLAENQDGIVKITQKELAMQIGTAREVVSRKLAQLEEKGYIKRERAYIKLIHIEGLTLLLE